MSTLNLTQEQVKEIRIRAMEIARTVADSVENPERMHVRGYGEFDVCGNAFVLVKIRKNAKLARILEDIDWGFHSSYDRAWIISTPLSTQSYSRNKAAAHAVAAYLRELGWPVLRVHEWID